MSFFNKFVAKQAMKILWKYAEEEIAEWAVNTSDSVAWKVAEGIEDKHEACKAYAKRVITHKL